jgi:hypothetical protein
MKDFSQSLLVIAVSLFVFMICFTIYVNIYNYYNGVKECSCAIEILNETDVKELCTNEL